MKRFFQKILLISCLLAMPAWASAQSDFKISKEPSPSQFVQEDPVLFLKPGGFLVAWRDYRLGEPAYFAQQFDSMGAPVDTNYQVLGNMAMAFLPDGRGMVVAQNGEGTIKGQVVQEKRPVAPPFEIGWALPWYPGPKAQLVALGDGFLFALGSDSLILRKFDRNGKLMDSFENRVAFPSKLFDFALARTKNDQFVLLYFSKTPPYGVYATFFDERDSVLAKEVPIQPHKTIFEGYRSNIRKVRAIALTDSVFEFFWGDLDSLFFKYATYSISGKMVRAPQKINGDWGLGTATYDEKIENFLLTNMKNGRFGALITLSAILDIPTMPELEINNTFLAWFSDAGDTLSSFQWKRSDIEYETFLFPKIEGRRFFLVDSNHTVFSAADTGDVFLHQMENLKEIGRSRISGDSTGANQREPEVVLLDSTRFLVTWKDEKSFRGQVVSSDGVLLGNEIELEGTRVVLLSPQKAVNLWKKRYWTWDWGMLREKVGFTLYKLPNWQPVYSQGLKSENETILKVSHNRFMLAHCRYPLINLTVFSDEGQIIADTSLNWSCWYEVHLLASEDSTFWLACGKKAQLFSFGLRPLTRVISLKVTPMAYLGNGQFLSVNASKSLFATVLDTNNFVKRSFLLKKNVSSENLMDGRLVRLDQNKFLFLWNQKHRIFGLSFSFNGEIFLDSLAFPSQTSSSQSHFSACTNGKQTLFVWADTRDWGEGYNIYGHLLPTSILTAVAGFEKTSHESKTFSLFQNYPNPFNPTTTISYQLPQAAHVTVAIYDVQGRLVETLVDGEKAAGRYSVQWHAENVPSGVYFYRIQAGRFTATKKLLLLK